MHTPNCEAQRELTNGLGILWHQGFSGNIAEIINCHHDLVVKRPVVKLMRTMMFSQKRHSFCFTFLFLFKLSQQEKRTRESSNCAKVLSVGPDAVWCFLQYKQSDDVGCRNLLSLLLSISGGRLCWLVASVSLDLRDVLLLLFNIFHTRPGCIVQYFFV